MFQVVKLYRKPLGEGNGFVQIIRGHVASQETQMGLMCCSSLSWENKMNLRILIGIF